IIVDAIQTREGKPGQIHRLGPDAFEANQDSALLHDVDLATVLRIGRRLGVPLPETVLILAVEVEDTTTFGEACTAAVAKSIAECVDLIIREIEAGNLAVRPDTECR
ncbi:MAG: hydrogenase maturation protease, partial [Chloroflexi bacterium]|nr:hydrogenase maturation protease [Chloroflexota bacterium]